ncbi:MAG: diguanylate cyclase [Candidatus Omnitrophica bacterium]|nr:diguanylate cyclase [Candidatus Omnitrophota bacterium]
MENLFRTFLDAPKGIKYKLTVAFALMSVIPMLVFGYLIIQYVFPKVSDIWDISIMVAFTIFLMISGFYLAKMIIYPVIKISAHAKGILEGEFDKKIDISREDEIGELGSSLNRLSTKLKQNMGELRGYGEKIKEINMEINRKVFALSGLLQINNLITSEFNLSEVLNLIIEKLAQLQQRGPAFVMLLRKGKGDLAIAAHANLTLPQPEKVTINPGQGLLGKVYASGLPLIIDTERSKIGNDKVLEELLPTNNIMVLPLASSGKIIGILGVGNNLSGFSFSEEEIEVISIFAKQIILAFENETLQRKTKELTVKDELTGLYNEKYIRDRLEEEIKRAISYQRPCSFIILEISDFERYRNAVGEMLVIDALKKIAQTFKESTSEIDKVARFSESQFAAILPEKNKRQSLEVAENIRAEISRFADSQKKSGDGAFLRINGGISSTPLDGETSIELINKALAYTEKAKEEGENKIVIS